jgi:glycosyltransferase involved in cell wall biosynthesis
MFVPSLRYGGAERVTLTLAQNIAERGYAVDLVLAQVEGPYLVDVRDPVQVVDLKAPRVARSLPALVRYLRRERPTAMLSMMAHSNIVALWARRLARVPTRLIVSERVSISWRIRHAPRRYYNRLLTSLIKRYYPWADGIVAVSDGVADDLTQVTGIPRQQVSTIYNPVVRPGLQPLMQVPVEHPWFQPDGPPVVLAVGRLTTQKDFSTLIQAFAQVRQTHDARLVILGDGKERPALERLVSQLGLEKVVSLPGFATNPYAYMVRSTLFVLSSRWEGLPGVLIEALYCGVPVVATDCPSGPREILRNGKYGHLVPIRDIAALARAMEESLVGKTRPAPDECWRPF